MKKIRNKKTGIWLLFTIVCLSSCSYKQDSFRLNGIFNAGQEDNYIMLFTFHNGLIHSVDTTRLKNGKFVFKGKEYLDDISLVSYGNYPDTVWHAEVILERGNIFLNMGYTDSIGGTPLNNLYQSSRDSSKMFWYETDKLNELFKDGTDITDTFEKLKAREKEYYKRLITTNISNAIGKQMLKDYAYIFSGKEMTELFNMLSDNFKSDPEIMEAMESKNSRDELQEKRNESVGTIFTNFKLTDPDGNERYISDYTGKSDFLFIDFWASWCGPCIQGIPGIKEVYAKYKEKGLEVLAVSLDNNEKAWKAALRKQDMHWGQLCDLNGGDDLREAYHFKGIPYGLLLDKSGKIIVVDIYNGEILERVLKQIGGE